MFGSLLNLIENTVTGVAETTLGVAKTVVGIPLALIDEGETVEKSMNDVVKGINKIGSTEQPKENK